MTIVNVKEIIIFQPVLGWFCDSLQTKETYFLSHYTVVWTQSRTMWGEAMYYNMILVHLIWCMLAFVAGWQKWQIVLVVWISISSSSDTVLPSSASTCPSPSCSFSSTDSFCMGVVFLGNCWGSCAGGLKV